MTEVGIRKILRPPVQNPGQGGSLPTPRREVPFQDEYQGNVELASGGDDYAIVCAADDGAALAEAAIACGVPAAVAGDFRAEPGLDLISMLAHDPATRNMGFDEYQGNVALGSKVRHVLGNARPAFRPGGRGDLRIISRPQAGLSDMDGVPAIAITQKFSSGCREHLIDQEPRHARSDSRCRAIARLRSAMFRLRSMSSRTSSTCSAA